MKKNIIKTFINLLVNIIENMTIPIMLLMVVIVILQVGIRFININTSLTWTEELSRFVFIIFSFMGILCSIQKGRTNSIEFILKHFSKKSIVFLNFFRLILYFVLCSFIVKISIPWVAFGMNQKSSVLLIPMGYLYISVPLLFGLLAIFHLAQIIDSIYSFKNSSEKN